MRKVVEKPDDNVEMKTVKKSEAQTTADIFYSHAIGGTLDAFATAEELSEPFTADPHHFSSWLKLKKCYSLDKSVHKQLSERKRR